MACSHPFGLERIENEKGELIGGRCSACKRTTYLGESLWTGLKRNGLWPARRERAKQ